MTRENTLFQPLGNFLKQLYEGFLRLKCLKYTTMTKHGIWFLYKEDEILWRWWWLRNPPQPSNNLLRQQGKYVSLFCEGCFNSLKDMDDFWTKYNDYHTMRRCKMESRYWRLHDMDRDIPKKYIQKYNNRKKSRKSAIRCQCIECCCYQEEEVRNCRDTGCPLHHWRNKG